MVGEGESKREEEEEREGLVFFWHESKAGGVASFPLMKMA